MTDAVDHEKSHGNATLLANLRFFFQERVLSVFVYLVFSGTTSGLFFCHFSNREGNGLQRFDVAKN